ncbi:MAG TPA: CDP-alcohol phosphatidyltransferase family protein [Methylomirabilota bacterium]|nr:CDP-alcohol phosphatidyltransferase family protein [Methylomirabilota bacterium]
MIDRAALYFATFDDLSAAQALVAHRPLAFRAVAAAVRAGARTVYLPLNLRDTPLGAAVAASPRARAAVVWLKEGGVPDPGPLLLVPAVVVIPAEVLRTLVAGPSGAAVADPEGTDTPAFVADADLAQALGTELAGGRPVGDALARASRRRGLAPSVDARCVLARDAEGRARAEWQLNQALGSAIDTRLDVLLHRRFSRYVTRAAIALGIAPNTITVASLVLGLVAVWCFWRATPASALAGLVIYLVAVILDHSDGEVARLTLTESRVGEWLDTVADTTVHTLTVVAMGVTTQAVTGTGLGLGLVGAAGIVASAFVAKWWPPRGSAGMGGTVEDMGSRDGFYALLVLFIALRAGAPTALPWLMILVALGSNVYWVVRAAVTLLRRA